MIVMKFGGTSVESAEAIQRVTGIVKSRLDRKPIVVVSAMGKTTNRLLKIADLAVSGQRDEALRELIVAARFSSPRIRHGAHRRRAFPGTLGAGEGPGGAGRIDAALHRRHLQLRRALVQPDRHELFPASRPERGACGFAQGDRHRSSPHAGHSAVRRKPTPSSRPPFRRWRSSTWW